MAQAQGSVEMALEARLLEYLQAEWAIATDWTVRCLVSQGILVVLVQYPSVTDTHAIDSRHIFSIVESAFHRDAEIRAGAERYSDLHAVRVYVRQEGEADPHGFYRFTWDDGASNQASTERLMLSGETPNFASDSNTVAESAGAVPPPHTPPSSPSRDPIPLKTTPVGRGRARKTRTKRDPDWDILDAEIKAVPRRRRANSGSILAAGLAATILLLGGGGYALSRPCVVGTCDALAIAQQMESTAMRQIAPGQSAQTVLEAYNTLMEASYLLDRIPNWSPHYTEAQEILTELMQESQKLERVVQAQRLAMAAAVQSQNPPHPLTVWREIKQNWQAAIAQLEQVPDHSPVYPLAQRKLTEYRANLSQIDHRILKEIEAQEWVDLARETAEQAETRQDIVTSVPGLRRVRQNWQSVINALSNVPSGTMAHAEAQQLLALYRPQLELAGERLQQEQASMQRFSQAQSLADIAQTAEQQNAWDQAVGQWQRALDEVQQIPEDSVSYEQVQPLVNSYQTALDQALNNLGFQDTVTSLERLCSGSPRRCLLSRQDDQMRVTITNAYEQELAGSNTTAPLSQLDPLIEQIARVSDRTRIPVSVYEASGELIGIYDPNANRSTPD
ncbi:hypothetical protein [Vacuolonema iberomarrocanum]|uniref:hypothetical protein n=1 Tax=Vacuolonema iberomarrocanum TaxID=3454632 RepID=UPI001A108CFE|nr:hypothetical protein [filamentous cyanobacterium LEGE 07170]